MNKAERYSHLLAPIRIAGHTYRSRVVSAPRGGIWNEDPECHDADPEQLAEIDLRAGGGQAAAFTRPHFRAVGKDRSQPLVQEGGGPVPSRPVGPGVADI